MTKSILTVCLLMNALASFAQPAAFKKEYFVEGRDTLPYRLLYPYQYNSSKKYPVVLFLHGSGARGNDNEKQLTNLPGIFLDSNNRSEYPCFLVVPQCSKGDVWVNFPDFPNSLDATDTPTTAAKLCLALTEKLSMRKDIDKNRIYVTGYSMGGEGTFDFIARKPDLFAAAIPVCAVADTGNAGLLMGVPIWAFHGEEDAVNNVLYTRIMVDALKKAGGRPRFTEYPGVGHHVWNKAYSEPELLQWLFGISRK